MSSPGIELVDEKNPAALRSEAERLRELLKEQRQSCSAMHDKLKEMDARYRREKTDKTAKEKVYHAKIAQLNSQLVGAIRRINHLINERSTKIKSANSHADYITSLEQKCSRKRIPTLAEEKSKHSQSVQSLLLDNSQYTAVAILDKENIKALKERSIESIRDIDQEILKAEEELEHGTFSVSNSSQSNL